MSIRDEEELYGFDMDQLFEVDGDADTNAAPDAESLSQSSQTSTLHDKLNEYHPKSFQGRLYTKLIQRENLAFQTMVESRRKHLIEDGIVDEEESLDLVNHPTDLPSQVQKRIYDRIAKEKEERRVELERKKLEDAANVYKNPWVLNKEREMVEYCKKRSTCQEPEMSATLDSLIEIVENKLKQFHDNQGTTTKEALEERKKVCRSLGYVREDMAEAITNTYHRLPMVINLNIQGMPEVMQVDLTPPRSQTNRSVTPKVPEQNSPTLELPKTPQSIESPVLAPPKTPSWTPRPCRKPLQTPDVPRRVTASQSCSMTSEDLLTPPKTPSWSPLTQPRPKKRQKKGVAVTKIDSGKKRKSFITDFYK